MNGVWVRRTTDCDKVKKLDLTLEQMTNEKQNKEMTKQSETGRIIAKIGEMELILHCYFSI